MDRDEALPFVVALLAVVALAVAAATLDTAVVTDGGSGFGAGGGDSGVGGGNSDGVIGSDSERLDSEGGGTSLEACWPLLREPPALVALALFFFGLFAAVYRSTGSPFAGGAVCVVASLPVGLLWGLLAFCGEPADASLDTEAETPGNGSVIPDGGGGGFGDGAAEAVSTPSILFALLVAIAVAVLLVSLLFARGGGQESETAETPAPEPDETSVRRIGQVAGTAADRIEADATTENEVYQAWQRMTDALDVESPETTTPAEFADTAVDAGMDRDDVADLTALFETVRYGGVDATDERERQAIETLRRIESDYGENR